MTFSADEIRATAMRELEVENFRSAVEIEKEKIRQRKPWWHRIAPFRITVTWR